jgi:hypothetical protein
MNSYSRRDVLRYGAIGIASLTAKATFSQTIGPGTGLPPHFREMSHQFVKNKKGQWITVHLKFKSDHDAENTGSLIYFICLS